MEPEQRGRTSRASSTSSLEVRCGCQYYQSDSLLPERRALQTRPPSRTMQQPPAVRCSEHDYEPIASPSPRPMAAPVVRITDTDVLRVADSDDSIDDRGPLPPELTPAGEIVLPLDGTIEDKAMEGRELGEVGDTSEEQETAQQLQDRLEERFLDAATPVTESRTTGELNTSQVDSSVLEELPLRRGARGLHLRIRTQAGKLRSRLRSIQRPNFSFPERQRKTTQAKSSSSGKSDKSRSEKRPSRMERIRSSLTERPRFSLPDRPKFQLPERPKFHLPEKAKFHIKRPNIRLPSALTRAKKPPPALRETQQRSSDSTAGSSRRNIFDLSTYPRIFDKKSKSRGEYATSSPKDSRAQSAESATFPRAKKGLPLSARWTQRFGDTAYIGEDHPDAEAAPERAHPWRHPSLEEPRLSVRMEEEILRAVQGIPWEEERKGRREEDDEEELQYIDYEAESPETSEQQTHPRSQETSRTEEESYEQEPVQLDPRLYGDRINIEDTPVRRVTIDTEEFRPIQRSRSLGEEVSRVQENRYEGSFQAVDPRRFQPPKVPPEEEEGGGEEIEEIEETSAPSDKEQQQSSGSSCDRRRRGIIEEIDSDEFFLRESGISHDDINLEKYLRDEIRDAFRGKEARQNETQLPPPQRPARVRSLRKRKEGSAESYEAAPPPIRPKRERAASRHRSEESEDAVFERERSDSRHRVVYHTEGSPREMSTEEPLDDIVIVKPIRRKSRSSLRSKSQSAPSETPVALSQILPDTPRPSSPEAGLPPVVPSRKKRFHRETMVDQRNGIAALVCNGHHDWTSDAAPKKPSPPQMKDDLKQLRIESVLAARQGDIEDVALRLHEEDYIEPAPIPPRRKSRSRGTSVAQDEDRTSHGAESLPEAGYVEEDIPRDEADSMQDLSGYAIVEKRDKPPRPPPPRKRRNKFATTPRPFAPKRPQRAYSTLGPVKLKDVTNIMSEKTSGFMDRAESMPYIEIDADDPEQKDLRSGEVRNKMQGRPLPAPPRPPRFRKEQSLQRRSPSLEEFPVEIVESTIATQTDPLPDDMVIEEEVTQAKLIVAHSQSGSQILVSTERIPSPSRIPTPPVPPLPLSQFLHREEEVQSVHDVALEDIKEAKVPEQTQELRENKHASSAHEERREERISEPPAFRPTLFSDDTLRISSLEVGDLKVDRLSVSQFEAQKIIASEVDALVISASELKGIEINLPMIEDNLSPSIIKELIAIRNHLETVAASQAQERHTQGSTVPSVKEKKSDIPSMNKEGVDEKRSEVSQSLHQQIATTEDSSGADQEEQTVVKTENAKVNERRRTSPLAQNIQEKSSLTLHTDQRLLSDSRNISDSDVEDSSAIQLVTSTFPSLSVEPEVLIPTDSTAEAQNTQWEQMESTESIPSSQIENEASTESTETKATRKSRSRSSSPSKIHAVRQTASPVRSLPPVISVTPDTPDAVTRGQDSLQQKQPQRAIISYSEEPEVQLQSVVPRESSQSPLPSFPANATHFIAFPTSGIPPELFPSTATPSRRTEEEPTFTDTAQQLLRVLRLAGRKAMRHFVGYLATRVGEENSRDKIKELELALCALLLLIAGLLILCFSGSRTVLHYHHWDYFNPPQ